MSELPAVVEAVARTRDCVDGLLVNRALRRKSSQVSAESALRGAWAVSVLSGVDVSLTALRSGEVADPIVQGALRVSSELGSLADTWTRAPRQVLARMHLLSAAGLVTDETALGRPIGNSARRMDMLSDTLEATRAPALVVAAVVLGEILALDAFSPSSVVVAHAAARLTLVERGLDPKSLVVIEVGSLEERARTNAMLGRYVSGTPAGLTEWVNYVADLINLGVRESTAICEAIQRG
jgi:hypothetical protein